MPFNKKQPKQQRFEGVFCPESRSLEVLRDKSDSTPESAPWTARSVKPIRHTSRARLYKSTYMTYDTKGVVRLLKQGSRAYCFPEYSGLGNSAYRLCRTKLLFGKSMILGNFSTAELTVVAIFLMLFVGIAIAGALFAYFDRKR